MAIPVCERGERDRENTGDDNAQSLNATQKSKFLLHRRDFAVVDARRAVVLLADDGFVDGQARCGLQSFAE